MVGLAAACAVAARGRTACVIERLPRPGLEASTHNSGVVHAGIYYPRNSLKVVLCVEGRERLYAFCNEHGVPCERCGKLIVAARANEIGALEALATRRHGNGVTDLDVVDPPSSAGEPHVEAAAAHWSPSSGIVEAEAYVGALAKVAAAREVALLPGAGAGSDRPLPGAQGRLRIEPRAARHVLRRGPPSAARPRTGPAPPRGQRHPGARRAGRTDVLGLPDPPRPAATPARAGRRHRLARTDGVARNRRARRRHGGRDAGLTVCPTPRKRMENTPAEGSDQEKTMRPTLVKKGAPAAREEPTAKPPGDYP